MSLDLHIEILKDGKPVSPDREIAVLLILGTTFALTVLAFTLLFASFIILPIAIIGGVASACVPYLIAIALRMSRPKPKAKPKAKEKAGAARPVYDLWEGSDDPDREDKEMGDVDR